MYYEWRGSVFSVWLVSLLLLRFHSRVNLVKYLSGSVYIIGLRYSEFCVSGGAGLCDSSHDACRKSMQRLWSCDEI